MRNRYFIKFLELQICMVIIVFCAALSLKLYIPQIESARVMSFSGKLFSEMKLNSMVYFAHHGIWPVTMEETLEITGLNRTDPAYDPYISAVMYDQGALTFTYRELSSGSLLTLRPAVRKENPHGPVIWTTGSNRKKLGWIISGEDRTDIPEFLLSRYIE